MHNFIYVTEKEAKLYKKKLIEMTLELQDLIREHFTFQYHFIGSSERNMITYNPKTNVGFDFDIDYAINDLMRNIAHLKFIISSLVVCRSCT